MKKKIIITGAVLFSILLLGVLTYKKETTFDKLTKIEVENNPFDFGTISVNDTIKHVFKIKNITKTPFVIQQVLPSCTCTVTKFDKKICRLNEIVSIEASFIPKPNQKGKTKTTVFVQCNAEKGVVKLELIGNIK
jgi:hypothetical protein